MGDTRPQPPKDGALSVGDAAPDFSLPTDGGGTVSLGALNGKPVVLYFYPRDDTPGCTTEALEFSADMAKFKKEGATIIGISKDSPTSHDKFKKKHALSLMLAADEDTEVAKAYGVWVEKNMYGRRSMGMERATFLIDATGVIRKIWRKVKVAGHAADVLAATKAL